MKVFILALLLLVVTSGVIGWGSWYVHRVCGEMMTVLADMDSLEMGDLSAYGERNERLDKVWRDSKNWMHILLGRETVDRIEEMQGSMGVYFLRDDALGFAWEKEKLTRYIKRIVKSEEISIDGIL